MINPYSNKGGIRRSEDFFGRTRELAELYGLIAQQSYVSVVGERRVGKSSLLNALALDFGREHISWEPPSNLCFALVDCQFHEQDGSEKDFLRSLVNRIAQASGLRPDGFDQESLVRLTEALASGPSPRRLVVLLDEVDVLFHNPNIPPQLFQFFLRPWLERYQVSMVMASREGSIELLVESKGQGSPFWNIFGSFYVGPFKEDEAKELVITPAERLDQPFSPRQVEEILRLGGHHPYFLQLACYHMFRLGPDSSGDNPDFAEVRDEFRREVYPHFSYLWQRLSELERAALQQFVVSRVLPERSIHANLIRKGILIQTKDEPRIFSTVFADFIQEAKESAVPTNAMSGVKGIAARLFE